MPATSEASGLIDIRQLGAQIGMGDDKKKSRIDDIMNLAGGGAFSPSLSAPVMSAPPIEEYAPQPEAMATGQLPAAGKSKALIFGAIGAGVVVICGAIGVAAMVMGKSDKADGDKTAGSATSTATAPTTSAAMTAPSTTPSDTTTAAAPAPTDTSTAPTATAAAPTATTAKTAATTATTATTAATKPTTTATATAAPTATAAAAAGADQPFNMGEAKARLASIAGSVQGCKKGDASGSGRVVVTFAPGGNVASAVVSGPPFEGTSTGACVASRFRGAHVPAFAGSPFSVSKSFTIN
jgi:cytoskeletal protein RodZ